MQILWNAWYGCWISCYMRFYHFLGYPYLPTVPPRMAQGNLMKSKMVAVFGSNSFSGSDFIDLLLSETKYHVMGITRSPEKSELFLPYKKNPNIGRFVFHQMDLNKDMDAIHETLSIEKPDYIVNFAAQSEVAPSWEHPEQWFQTNAVAIASLGNFLRKQKSIM